MIRDTAIVFTATFLGVISAVITFNILLENHILPAHAPSLARIEVEPELARAEEPPVEAAPTIAVAAQESDLAKVVTSAFAGARGKYGVAIKNLKTGESYFGNENDQFESASLYKLWVMGATYKQIKEGTIKEDEVLSASIPELNKTFNIASESAEQTQGGVSLSVKSALSQMITISHNYAALLLSSRVKIANVGAFLKEKGLIHSATGSPPKTTASDTLAFFEKLYTGELADKEYSDKMLELLKKQQLNKKLPKYLPAGTVIAHKTGELGDVTHDAGIVYTPKGDYVIVILSDSSNPKGAEERLANASRDVYQYFTK